MVFFRRQVLFFAVGKVNYIEFVKAINANVHTAIIIIWNHCRDNITGVMTEPIAVTNN